MKKSQRPRAANSGDQAQWLAAIKAAHALKAEMPQELRVAVQAFSDRLCDMGEEQQIPPRVMAVAVATLLGSLAFADAAGDIRDNEAIDDFLYHCKAAMHVAVAEMRIAAGWKPADA